MRAMVAVAGGRGARVGKRRAVFGVALATLARVALATMAAMPPTAARGQSNDEIQTATQFNVSTPGARSLALGGAFVAVADDATAAYANPAGLVQLVEPEASLEARSWAHRSRFTERGHTPETGLTGIGIDLVDGLSSRTLTRDEEAVSFASYVHTGRRWAAAIHRHQLADFRAALSTQGAFVGMRDNSLRLSPAKSALDLEIAGVALSGAWRARDDLFVGLSVVRHDFALASHTDRYQRQPATGDPVRDGLTGAFFGPADFRPQNVLNTQTQTGDDDAWSWTAGVLWRPLDDWSVGVVRRSGAAFDFRASYVDGPASPTPGVVDPTLGGRGTFQVPDVWAVGIAYRPGEAWLVAFDWNRVEYGAAAEDLVNLLQAARGQLAGFRVDDADEVHLGVEFQAVRTRVPLSLRLGAWLDPDHRLRFAGRDPALRARFRPGRDDVHVAGGLGIVLRRFQLDLAYDHGNASDTLSLSAVQRF
jgi:long-subunit fatty acid transport protein